MTAGVRCPCSDNEIGLFAPSVLATARATRCPTGWSLALRRHSRKADASRSTPQNSAYPPIIIGSREIARIGLKSRYMPKRPAKRPAITSSHSPLISVRCWMAEMMVEAPMATIQAVISSDITFRDSSGRRRKRRPIPALTSLRPQNGCQRGDDAVREREEAVARTKEASPTPGCQQHDSAEQHLDDAASGVAPGT